MIQPQRPGQPHLNNMGGCTVLAERSGLISPASLGRGKGKDPGTMLQRFEPVGAAYWPLQPPLCPRRYSLAPVFVRCLGRPALLCVQGFGTSVQTHIDCGKLGPPECSTVRASYSAGREPEDLGALVVAAAATAAGSRSAPHSLLSFGTSRRRE